MHGCRGGLGETVGDRGTCACPEVGGGRTDGVDLRICRCGAPVCGDGDGVGQIKYGVDTAGSV